MVQVAPVSGGSSGAPVESASVDISSATTASDDILLLGGLPHPTSRSGQPSQRGIKFTSISATGATANRTYSGTGGTFTVCVFKRLGDGATLY